MTRRQLFQSAAALSATPAFAQPAQPQAPPSRQRFDSGWKFALGHASDPALDFGLGAASTFAKSGNFAPPARVNFDDSKWRPVQLPHDWAIELPFVNDRALASHGFKPLGRAYPASSVGWYRKVFETPAAALGRRITLHFDGVFRDSIVVLNGHFIGRNMSGYSPFHYDLSDYLNYGGRNVLLVRADATLNEGWFYEGAGIYRHVWLKSSAPLHIADGGLFVTSSLEGASASLLIEAEVVNAAPAASPFRLVLGLLDPAGKAAATLIGPETTLAPGETRTLVQQIRLPQPLLWSIEQPHLYTLIASLETAAGQADSTQTTLGIRTFRWDADQGFFLNGKHVKIKGTCNHQDHAGLGAALPDRVHFYRVERLKAMGSNAWRTAHNPPAAELLDACDRLGMLVIDETRMASSSPEGLSQLERMIRRDRNHPSIVAWSLLNEEPIQGTDVGARVGATMKRLARRLDPTRPVTVAMDNSWGRGMAAISDIQGFNYRDAQMEAFHAKFPHMPIIGSESGSTVSTRGVYDNDKAKGYVSAYDLNAPYWASTAEFWWKIHAERPYIAGGFVWTGFDYRGEPTPYQWPCISSHFGILDTCGFPKDNFYYYKAWWDAAPLLHLFPHWNWEGKEGQEIDVWCHSNLDRVELFLNGQSLGAQDMPRNSHLAWKVKYVPGVLEARGFKAGKQVLTAKRETTGPAAAILLRPDRPTLTADGDDVAMVAAEVVDSAGRLVSTASNEIVFTVTGARFLGVGNGDPSSHEMDNIPQRRAFNGLCMLLLQSPASPAEIKVEATSPSLKSATLSIPCLSRSPAAYP